MTLIEIASLVIPAMFGGGLFTFFIQKKKETRDDFREIINTLSADNTQLRIDLKASVEKLEQLRAKTSLLEAKLVQLQNKLVLLENAHIDSPLPMWLKDVDGTILALNQAYETTFLVPMGKTAEECIGLKDSDIWPIEIANQYALHDKLTLSKKVLDTQEDVLIGNVMETWRVIKYVRSFGKIAIGVAGIAIPEHKLGQ